MKSWPSQRSLIWFIPLLRLLLLYQYFLENIYMLFLNQDLMLLCLYGLYLNVLPQWIKCFIYLQRLRCSNNYILFCFAYAGFISVYSPHVLKFFLQKNGSVFRCFYQNSLLSNEFQLFQADAFLLFREQRLQNSSVAFEIVILALNGEQYSFINDYSWNYYLSLWFFWQ